MAKTLRPSRRRGPLSPAEVPSYAPSVRRSRWTPALLAVVVLLGVALLGCGDDDDGAAGDGATTEAAGEDAAASVTIRDLAFEPDELTVQTGDVIEVSNEDGVQHTFTSDDAGFDTVLEPGGSGTARVATSEPGTYDFVCSFHPAMQGSITVE